MIIPAQKKFFKGFTLIELLIVIAILGILIAVALPRYTKSMNEARTNTCVSNQRSVKSSLETYKMRKENDYKYPLTQTPQFNGMLANAEYFERIPRCPLDTVGGASNTGYTYSSNGTASYLFGCSFSGDHTF